jgi:hypothetical protein
LMTGQLTTKHAHEAAVVRPLPPIFLPAPCLLPFSSYADLVDVLLFGCSVATRFRNGRFRRCFRVGSP